MALPHLSRADIEAVASETAPLPSLLPDGPRLGPRPPRPSRRTRAQRAAERAPPVSRRLRRYYNDLGLAIAAADAAALPATPADLRVLFERSSRSAWAPLTEGREFAILRDAYLDLREEHVVNNADHRSVHTRARVDRRLRSLVKQRGPVVTDVVRQVEDCVVNLPPGGSVELRMPHAMGRMVAHGVAQFHCMRHRSVDIGSERVTVIHATAPVAAGPRLVDVLAA